MNKSSNKLQAENCFFSQVQLSDAPFGISYADELMLLGSCFSEHIGQKLSQAFFRVTQNPFGILYNPASIARCMDIVLSDTVFTTDDLFFHKDLWNSALHHGSFSDITPEKCLEKINDSLANARQKIKSTKVLLITFGTSWVYEQNGHVVGNCHKQPSDMFTHRRMSAQEIVDLYLPLVKKLPDTHFIFTVSPVRHWKDGAHQNQLSKSVLLLAIDDIVRQNDEQCSYFPSYEIMLDELRDYRFYAEDMQHPNAVAVDYIWKRFAQTYFSADTQLAQAELEQLRRDLDHRPLHPETEEYQLFRVRIEKKQEDLRRRFPWI